MEKHEVKKLSKAILTIALPMVIQGFVFQIQSLTDKIFLGNLETEYLSAVGAAQFPFNTTLDTLFALCIGITIVVSQLYGSEMKKDIVKVTRSAIFYNSILSLLLFVLWFFFSKAVFHIMSVDAVLLDNSMKYVKICSIYFLVAGIDASLQGMLQGMGKTKSIMYAGIVKVVVNVVLDWILIFGKFGLKPLNIEGAAIATLCANLISAMLIVICGLKQINIVEGKSIKNIFSTKFSLYKNTIKIGIPAGMELFLWNGSNLVLVKFLNSISYVATTIYTLTFSIEVLIYTIFSSIGKAGLTVGGIYLGEDNRNMAKKVVKVCLMYSSIIVAIGIAIFLSVPNEIIGLFTDQKEIIESTAPYLCFTAFIMIPKSINVVVGNGIRTYGDTKWMLYTQIVGSIFVILFSYILVKQMQVGVVGIYITIIADEITRATLNCLHYFKGKMVNYVKKSFD